MAKAVPLALSSEEITRLESITKARTLQAQTVTRARINAQSALHIQANRNAF